MVSNVSRIIRMAKRGVRYLNITLFSSKFFVLRNIYRIPSSLGRTKAHLVDAAKGKTKEKKLKIRVNWKEEKNAPSIPVRRRHMLLQKVF